MFVQQPVESTEKVGRRKERLIDSAAVLFQPADRLLHRAGCLVEFAASTGRQEEAPLLIAALLARTEKQLAQTKAVLVGSPPTRGRQQDLLVRSAESPGETAKRGREEQKRGRMTRNVVFRPFTSKGVPVTTTNSVRRSLAVLKLPKIVAQIITFAQGVVTAMTNNPRFPSPTPPLSSVTAAVAALGSAESAALTRAKGAATTRNDKKAALIADLQTLRTYVQNVADADRENSANIIQSAGFAVKKTVVRKPRAFQLVQGAASGTAKVFCPTAARRASYDWEYSIDGGKTWVALPSTLQAKTSITGLAQGVTLLVRFRAVTKAGVADWSQPLSLFLR